VSEAYRLIIAPKAAGDLAAIHDFIAKNSPENAARAAKRIMAAMELLQDVPHRAAIALQPKGLAHPVRSVVVFPYIVYFPGHRR
jgi:plasmid stabilization system protein ParE